jgi:putative acetyltransferase
MKWREAIIMRGGGLIPMTTIRAETTKDYAAVRRVNELAFESAQEADLVDALREAARPFVSLVAESDGQVVGHIFFSPVSVESGEGSFTAMGLGPMAVLPESQRQGVGSLLVRAGLEECKRVGFDVIVVLGHPNYYPRFGFVPAGPKGLRCVYDVPEDVFMVMELKPGALGGRRGLVKYHPKFDEV